MYKPQTKIQYVRGVGPTKAKELNKAGICTVLDLLEYQPNHYIYPGETPIGEAKQGHVIIKAKVQAMERLAHRPVVVARLNDGTGTCKAIWYNQRYVANGLQTGMTATFWGNYKGGVLHQPRFTTCQFKPDEVCGGDYGIYTTTIRAALREVLDNVELPNMCGGFNREYVFRGLHFPSEKSINQKALEKLKFDELLLMQLAMQKRKMKHYQQVSNSFNWDEQLDEEICKYFPYKFTEDQNKSIHDINRDVTRLNAPMQRLLQGEVGSGKTAVAFYAAMLAALNHKRALILCPTTILAQQHYDTLRSMGWDDVWLFGTSGTPPIPHITIATHAVLNNFMVLRDMSLVIIDEFQKFGVAQRAKIQKHNPHLLLMSATPIPRSMMMTVFGDLDVSTIRELPIKRGTVITKWILPDKREAMYEIIERELAKGHQAYVVYPRIGDEEQDVSARKGFYEIQHHFPNCNILLLTGKHITTQKNHIMQQFKEQKHSILVSTIIAEVGLDCPNATVMVVEGADRFGLSQLHQLRGRVCRSQDTAYCFLVAETANQKSIDRLEVIEKCNDGFEIAEHDLRLRGSGEMFGLNQHGLPNLKFASLVDDYGLLVKARETAVELVDKLDEPENTGLKEMLEYKYNDTIQLGDVR